ncbi:MAG TPA: FRG domain-containing protein [Pyrinomonadaceae bacterium]
MAFPSDYWRSYEKTISSLPAFQEAIRRISAYERATGSKFVWRGVANARHPLYSSIVRAHKERNGLVPTEKQLRQFEREVLDEAREWNLDWHREGGRLTGLEILAAMQHHGIPTRLLDFSFNPLFALAFATEKHDDKDGRIFAIDISDRLVDRSLAALPDPWWWNLSDHAATDWTARSWAWRPPPFEPRIVRQAGCFLVGGVPTTTPLRNAKLNGEWRPIHADEVRASMSVPFQLINYEHAVAAFEGKKYTGKLPKVRAFTLRVQDKASIREELQSAFDLSHRTLFPDFPGLAAYGSSFR